MTSPQSLSSIRKEHPRTVWPNEAGDFTPWLEKNIGELSMTLGMSLKVKGTEVQAGTRYVDIVATDTRSGHAVVIENQLENSDGDHLSRMLYYAASRNADTIIWIAREFEEEHWLTLKWLNQRTGSETKFFGIAIEIWKIEDSPPAPHFQVVVAPDDWIRGLPPVCRGPSVANSGRLSNRRLSKTIQIPIQMTMTTTPTPGTPLTMQGASDIRLILGMDSPWAYNLTRGSEREEVWKRVARLSMNYIRTELSSNKNWGH